MVQYYAYPRSRRKSMHLTAVLEPSGKLTKHVIRADLLAAGR